MEEKREKELLQLLKRWNINVKDIRLFNIALIHPTYAFEHRLEHLEHNQRLEFLGDAVVDLVIGEYLYKQYDNLPEGDLTKMRSAVVCEEALARAAHKMNLGRYLLLGKGELQSGGRKRASILADAFEALVGAVYLEAGLETARRFILQQLQDDIKELSPGKYRDFKTRLQEFIQRRFDENVVYVLLDQKGPDHAKWFTVGVTFKNRLLAKGQGKNKKEAEQMAAKKALEKLENGQGFSEGENSLPFH